LRVYTAIVGPKDGEWFPVEVPEVPGVFTQGRDLVEVEEMAREAIALMTDTPIAEIAIRIEDHRYQIA
jgi:predicted RNase H-like HicB family nuclease